MKNDKNFIMIAVVAIIVIIMVVVVIATKIIGKNNANEAKSEDYTLEIREGTYVVDDPNTFYTVAGTVRKYLASAYSKNPDELEKLLAEDYKKKNEITKENVLQKITTYSTGTVFEPKRIYEKDLTNTMKRFYVFGKIKQDLYEQVSQPKDYYIVVDFDYETKTFAVSFDDILDESTIK